MKVAVIGAGTMGSGIAQTCAVAGHDVMLTSAIFPCDTRVSRECRLFSFIGAMVIGVVVVAVGELVCELVWLNSHVRLHFEKMLLLLLGFGFVEKAWLLVLP